MKTLVVYFTRTGNTEKVAKELALECNADIEQLNDLKNRSGTFGYLIAGKDAIAKKEASISKPKFDPAEYDMVLLGTPIWAYTMASAVRTYLTMFNGKFKYIAFFCTHGGNHKDTFKHMEDLSKTPVAVG